MSWNSAAVFYDQLRVLLATGMPIVQALELAAGVAPSPHRELGRSWSAGCAAGATLAAQLAQAGEPPLAVAMVRAGEASGRLPELCGEIAGYCRHAIALRTLVIGRLIYPAGLLHVALVAAAVPAVAMRGGSPWLLLAGPATLWAALAAAGIAARSASPTTLARLALLPGVHALTLPLVAGNVCLVLRAALGAGMLMAPALELAADACGNRVYAERLRTAAAGLSAGRLRDLTAALGACGFPAEVVQLVANGEVAGTLEETLARCATYQQERFRLRTEWTARVATGTVYGLAMLFAALTVISFWMGYVGTIKELANGAGD